MSFNLSFFWLAIPSSIRYALVLFLILFLFGPLFRYLLKKLGKYVTCVAEYGLILILFILEKILILLYKIFGSFFNPINQLFENIAHKMISTVRKWKELWKKQWVNEESIKKRYRTATYLLPILLALIIYQWPTSSIANWWKEEEVAMLTEQLQVQMVSTEVAKKEVSTWIQKLKQSSVDKNAEYSQLVLKPGYEGGNIRESPSTTSRPITVIAPGELIYYLEEESTAENGTIWYKVQTEIGETGWISGKIVDTY